MLLICYCWSFGLLLCLCCLFSSPDSVIGQMSISELQCYTDRLREFT